MTSYSVRNGLSRRTMIAAAATVAAAGVIDIFRGSGSKASPLSTSGSRRQPTAGVAGPRGTGSKGSPPASAHTAGPLHGNGDSPGPHHQGALGHGKHPADVHVTLPAPTVRIHSRPIYSLADLGAKEPHHAIGLTVDDGPDPLYTPKVLRLLDKYQMQASFCVVGIHAESYPKLIRDIHRAGHILVNHTYTHVQPFPKQTEQRIVEEITRTQRAIEKATKFTPELFRSPGGDWSSFVFRAIASYGLTPLDWDVDPRDWAMPGKIAIEKAMLKGRPGDIVLCHDGGGNRIETVRALRKVLPTWKHRGYKTVALTVPEHTKKLHT